MLKMNLRQSSHKWNAETNGKEVYTHEIMLRRWNFITNLRVRVSSEYNLRVSMADPRKVVSILFGFVNG